MNLSFKKNKKIKDFQKVEIRNFADVFWGRILKTIFVLLIIGVFCAVATFLYISRIFDKNLSEEDTGSSLILDKKNLNNALNFAKEKKNRLEEVKQKNPEIIDPSTKNSYSLEQ